MSSISASNNLHSATKPQRILRKTQRNSKEKCLLSSLPLLNISIDFILIHSLIRFTSVALCFLSLSVTFLILFVQRRKRKNVFRFDKFNYKMKTKRLVVWFKEQFMFIHVQVAIKASRIPRNFQAHILCTDGRTKWKSIKMNCAKKRVTHQWFRCQIEELRTENGGRKEA